MKIDDNYSIENDTNQWILNYHAKGDINPKTNKPTISENKWYCGTLKQCLDRYLDESLKPAQSIQELKGFLNIAMESIVEYTNQLNQL